VLCALHREHLPDYQLQLQLSLGCFRYRTFSPATNGGFLDTTTRCGNPWKSYRARLGVIEISAAVRMLSSRIPIKADSKDNGEGARWIADPDRRENRLGGA